jgi:hypothetical protein
MKVEEVEVPADFLASNRLPMARKSVIYGKFNSI